MDGIERSCPGRAGGHSSALAKSPMVLVMSAPTVASLQKVDCVSPALAGGDIVTTPALAGGILSPVNLRQGRVLLLTTPILAWGDIVTSPAVVVGILSQLLIWQGRILSPLLLWQGAIFLILETLEMVRSMTQSMAWDVESTTIIHPCLS